MEHKKSLEGVPNFTSFAQSKFYNYINRQDVNKGVGSKTIRGLVNQQTILLKGGL